jgi:hypothetical protein
MDFFTDIGKKSIDTIRGSRRKTGTCELFNNRGGSI